jgi:hypothetical protein
LGWGFGNPFPFVLSFEVKCTSTGVFPVAVQNLISPTRRSYVSSYQITNANQWQRFELPIPVDGTNSLGSLGNLAGLALRFSIGSGSQWVSPTPGTWASGDFFTTPTSVPFVNFIGTQNWNIRRVKITPGSAGTNWTVPSIPNVLSESRRYFENGYYQFDTGNGANAVSLSIPFKTAKRIVPSMSATMVQGTLTTIAATTEHLIFTGSSAANGVIEFNWAASAVM